jgi:hypothetical protein
VYFDRKISLDESDLQLIASPHFLKSKSEEALIRYQILLDEVVASKNAIVKVVHGERKKKKHIVDDENKRKNNIWTHNEILIVNLIISQKTLRLQALSSLPW